MRRLVPWLMPLALACGETGQQEIALPLYLSGDGQRQVEAFGGVDVTLQEARLAFGPLYLCPGVSAGELCDTARLEWLDSAVIDLLDDGAHEVGVLTGQSGSVRSLMYDLGLSSQLTASEPLVLAASRALDGRSLRLRGHVDTAQGALPFSADVTVAQNADTEVGVPLVRRSLGFAGEYEVLGDERALRLTLRGANLLRGVDFGEYVQEAPCGGEEGTTVCRGSQAFSCHDDGSEQIIADCADSETFCVHGRGCQAELRIAQDSAAQRAIRGALLVGATPTFDWNYEDN